MLEPHLQPPQFENLNERDSHSSNSLNAYRHLKLTAPESGESDSGAVSSKYPYAFKELLRCIDRFSGKTDENDFEVWLVDFTEDTNDCMWRDVERARWFSQFLEALQR